MSYETLYKFYRLPGYIKRNYYKLWNLLKFRMYGIKYGTGLSATTHIYLFLKKEGQVVVHKNLHITSGDNTNPLSRIQRSCLVAERADSQIVIGNNVGISSSCIWAKQSITIGDYVNIGADCIIMDSDAHSLDWRYRMTYGPQDVENARCAPVVIENHAFIGTRSIILKGVTIGARSIVAAGSVVTKSIPPDCIAGGNPCRVIRKLSE